MKSTKLSTPEAPPAPPKKPLVSFTMLKKGDAYHALAIKTVGREVVDEMVLEQDDARFVVEDAVDKAYRAYGREGVDPFQPKEE